MNDVTKGPSGNGLVDRAKAVLLSPKDEWPKIAAETSSIADVFKGYALPLMLIGPIATFIGLTVLGINAVFMTYHVPIGTGITILIASLIGSVVSLGIMTLIADALAPQFGGTANRVNAFKLVTYSMTAVWVSSIILIVPSLGIIVLLSMIYGFYLLYLGTGPIMKVPADKAAIYTVVLLVCGFIAQYIVNRITMSMAMPSLPFG